MWPTSTRPLRCDGTRLNWLERHYSGCVHVLARDYNLGPCRSLREAIDKAMLAEWEAAKKDDPGV